MRALFCFLLLIAYFFSWEVKASDWLMSDEERHCIELTEAVRALISEPGFFEQEESTISLKVSDAEFTIDRSGKFKDIYSNMVDGSMIQGTNYFEKKGEGEVLRYYTNKAVCKITYNKNLEVNYEFKF